MNTNATFFARALISIRETEIETVLRRPVKGRRMTVPGKNGPVEIYWHGTAEKHAPVLFEMHGGGFATGDAAKNDALRERICGRGIHVVGINYRKSPEHAYPVALNDVCAVIRWYWDNAEALGVSTHCFCVMGESAGGNLAAAAALRLKNDSHVIIKNQILHYPFLDMLTAYDEVPHYPQDFSKETAEAFNDLYCPPYLRSSPYVSPACADYRFLRGLPQALIVAAGNDYLKADAKRYARLLAEADVPATYLEMPDAHHGYIEDGFNEACYALNSDEKKRSHSKAFRTLGEKAVSETVRFIKADLFQ